MVPVRRRPVLAVDAHRLCLGLLNDRVADRTNAEGPGTPAPFRFRIAHRAARTRVSAAPHANASIRAHAANERLDLLMQIRHQRQPADRISLPQ